MVCIGHEVCLLIILHISWIGGVTLPSKKISNKISLVLFLVLCAFVYVCWGRGQLIDEQNHWIVCKIMAQRKNQRESWSGISGGLSVPLASFVTLLSVSVSLCLYHIGTPAIRWVIKPGYHLSSLVTPQGAPEYPHIIDGKMETKGRKYIKKVSSHILFYLLLTILPQSSAVRPILLASLLFEVIFIVW